MSRITAPFLKAQYPKIWREVESKVADDLTYLLAALIKDGALTLDAKRKKRMVGIVAHNAAFVACDAYHYGVER